MADYRCYPLTLGDLISGPAQVIACMDDVSAVAMARSMLPKQPFEVWLGARRIYATNRKP